MTLRDERGRPVPPKVKRTLGGSEIVWVELKGGPYDGQMGEMTRSPGWTAIHSQLVVWLADEEGGYYDQNGMANEELGVHPLRWGWFEPRNQ